jgi:hypothetical protein
MTDITDDTGFKQALQAAMSARMAQTARSIDTDEDCAGQERLSQYSLLSDFLNSR